MIDGFGNHQDMVNSVCDGFTNSINDIIDKNAELLCNQDGYEILTSVFNQRFRKHDIENANIKQIISIANELSELLENNINIEQVCHFINSALQQSFGEFKAIKFTR
ncbi:hypothetical protein GCM10009111_18970 [Colwellia asteriadis]|uniref:Uncharacterized protein n=1 Tax=Colwellia asteriadis TaxID=517723 RepID=A0ABN1L7V7_9GAMM